MYATICHLPDTSILWLQQLTQLNIDSRDGFREAAENVLPGSPSLSALFLQIAGDRAAQARELQDMVARNDEPPRRSGSVLGAVHRAWMNLRDALGGGEDVILAEAERGEAYLRQRYEEALSELADCECFDTLRNHYITIKASHERICDLAAAVP